MKPRRALLTAKRARELFVYTPSSGVLRNRVRRSPKAPAGAIAGTLRANGYRQVCADGVLYYEHRVIWLMMTGRWPTNEIDHKRGKSNRWENLRAANYEQNGYNVAAHRDNSTGMKGVIRKRGKFQARICVRGKNYYLGTFKTATAAGRAYQRAARAKHGEFFYSGGARSL